MVKSAYISKGTPAGRISPGVSKFGVEEVVSASGISGRFPTWSDPIATWSDPGYLWSGNYTYQPTSRPAGSTKEDSPSSGVATEEKVEGRIGKVILTGGISQK